MRQFRLLLFILPFLSSSGIDPGPAVFELVHRIHDDPAHTDELMYSWFTGPQNEEGRMYGLKPEKVRGEM